MSRASPSPEGDGVEEARKVADEERFGSWDRDANLAVVLELIVSKVCRAVLCFFFFFFSTGRHSRRESEAGVVWTHDSQK